MPLVKQVPEVRRLGTTTDHFYMQDRTIEGVYAALKVYLLYTAVPQQNL